MSLHFAANAFAFAAYAGSLRSRWPYRFIAEPQPAALMTMVSTSASLRTRRSASWPPPSHLLLRPHARRAHRSTPASAERRLRSLPPPARARLPRSHLPKNTRWTHPRSRPTRLRCSPCAGMRAGRSVCPNVIGGNRRSIACRRWGSSARSPDDERGAEGQASDKPRAATTTRAAVQDAETSRKSIVETRGRRNRASPRVPPAAGPLRAASRTARPKDTP